MAGQPRNSGRALLSCACHSSQVHVAEAPSTLGPESLEFLLHIMGNTTNQKMPNSWITLRLSVTLLLAMAIVSAVATWYSGTLEASSGLSPASARIEQGQVVDPDI